MQRTNSVFSVWVVVGALGMAPAAWAAGVSGHWSFEEGSGTVISDFSPQGNDGTISSDTLWTARGAGWAIQLPGHDGDAYGSIPHDDTLNFNGSIHLSAWINFSVQATQTLYPIIVKGSSSAAYALYVHADGTIGLLANYQTGGTQFQADTAPGAVPPGVWTHVAASYDQNYLRLYVNGVLEQEAPFTHPIVNNDQPLYLGIDYPGFTERYKGQIDDVVVLTPSAHWSFEEGVGTVISDSSPQGNDGTLSSDTLWTAHGAGSAIQLPGHDGDAFGSIPHSNTLNVTGSIHLSAWINFSVQATQTLYPIIVKGSSSAAYALYVHADGTIGLLANYQTGGTQFQADTAPGAVPPGVWTHVAASYDQNYLRLYVNGVLEQAAPFAHAIVNNDEPLYLGIDYPGFTERYKGQIDDVVIAVTPVTEPIPTVSEWGLIVMSLLVLTAGTLVYTQRRPIHA